MQRLDKNLNFALRIISGKRKFEHISRARANIRKELGWPTADELYRKQSLNLLHKINIIGEPQTLVSQLQVTSNLRPLSTRQNLDFALPCVRTEADKRRFFYDVL